MPSLYAVSNAFNSLPSQVTPETIGFFIGAFVLGLLFTTYSCFVNMQESKS
jgi:hypothetical protein